MQTNQCARVHILYTGKTFFRLSYTVALHGSVKDNFKQRYNRNYCSLIITFKQLLHTINTTITFIERIIIV